MKTVEEKFTIIVKELSELGIDTVVLSGKVDALSKISEALATPYHVLDTKSNRVLEPLLFNSYKIGPIDIHIRVLEP